MLRIARLNKSKFAPVAGDPEQLLSAHGRLTALIKRHLSPVTASLLAKPVILPDSDDIEWYSDLQGQPQPLNSLPEKEQQQARQLLDDRLTSLANLAGELPKLDPEAGELQDLLRNALYFPGNEAVYIVNGQPVITFWGFRSIDVPAYSPLANIAPAHSATAAAAPASSELNSHPRSTRLLPWLGGLMLLTLLGLLLWFWLAEQNIHWQAYNPFVEKPDHYQLLLDEITAAGEDCLLLQRIYQENQFLQTPEEKFVLLKQQLQARLEVCAAHEKLLTQIRAANGDCDLLQQILSENLFLRQPTGSFVAIKKDLEKEIRRCRDFLLLQKQIQEARNDCPLLQKIQMENPYLQHPEGKFAALAQELQKLLELCSGIQALQKKIDNARNDCPALKKLHKDLESLQLPEDKHAAFARQLDAIRQDCEVSRLREKIEKAGADCQELKKIASESFYLKNPEGEFVALKKQLQKRLKPCRVKKTAKRTKPCPGERPPELAPDVAIVFDASLSMSQSMSGRPRIRHRRPFDFGFNPYLNEALRQLSKMQDLQGSQSNTRMKAAKIAVSKVVKNIPSDVNIGLVQLRDCPRAQRVGFFPPSKRRQLLSHINRLQPTGGTPLADGLYKAGQMVDGVNKPATIIVISDGEESCKSNPCAIARNLARAKQQLTINVVDIMGSGAGNCIARATRKGRVYTAKNVQDLITMTQSAASSVIVPEHCRRK